MTGVQTCALPISELPDLCASEAELFERLLGTPVEREATIVQGGVRCVTRVRVDLPAQADGRAGDARSREGRSRRRSSDSNTTTTPPTPMPARREA